MAVSNTHVNASLRLLDTQRDTVQTITRIRPGIQGNQVEFVLDAVQTVRGRQMGGAMLTVVSELVKE